MSAVSALGTIHRLPTWVVWAVIHVYQLAVAPLLGPACRYEPSCSAYAMLAIERHGALRGSWLAVRRLSRCHPLGGFGMDPVP